MKLQWVPTVILAAHWLIILALSIRVIMRRAPVGVSLAWLAVAFSVPFVGAVLYLLFGEKRLGRERGQRINGSLHDVAGWQKTLKARFVPAESTIDPWVEPLFHQVERVLGSPALPGNSLELLDDFQTIFDRLVADVDAAHSTVYIDFYIWHEGGRTADVVHALIRAARRGVRCLALADALGSKAFFRTPSLRRLRDAGVEFTAALPTGAFRSLAARADLRNHRKIVVIDESVAYSGSQNLVDPRFFKQKAGVGEWVDAMVRMTGPAVISLGGVFRLDWAVENGSAFQAAEMVTSATSATGESLVQVVPSGPDLQSEAIHQVLLTAIYAARREIVMTTPYFVPDDSILTALVTAALRGVDITLIVPARNDSFLVRHASVAHFDDLMAAGVRIARFNGGLLHTKSLTIDGTLSVFGSVNLDMRSLWLNFEISLLVYDPGFTGRLRSLQNMYLKDSEWVDPKAWQLRSAGSRFMANACRLVGPLL